MTPCARCKSPAGACICGEASYELGRIFALAGMAKQAGLVGSDDELDRLSGELLDALDDAEKHVRSRLLRAQLADRGRERLQ